MLVSLIVATHNQSLKKASSVNATNYYLA